MGPAGLSLEFADFAGSVRAMRRTTIWLVIALLLIGAGLLLFGHWLWFGGERQKASVAVYLLAAGFVIAFVREFSIRR